MAQEESKASRLWLDEIHLTKDGGVIKRIYRFGESDSEPQKG